MAMLQQLANKIFSLDHTKNGTNNVIKRITVIDKYNHVMGVHVTFIVVLVL